jgi:hypothetical protein
MGVTSGGRASLGRARESRRGARTAELNAVTAAWIAAIPCALLTYLAVVRIGPWLGDRLFPAHQPFDFFGAKPNPRAHASQVGPFLVSLGGPILLALTIVWLMRRRLTLPRAVAIGAVALTQAALIVVVAACLQGQRRPQFGFDYFSTRTLAVSGLIAVSLLLASRSPRLRGLFGTRALERRRVRLAVGAVAAVVTISWLLPAVQTDVSITGALDITWERTGFYIDETFAVLNGLTPFVTFTPQYGGVWSYLVAVPMLVFGKSLLAYTTLMATATAVAFLAAFGVLRRVTRNSLAAFLLFVPFLATTLFPTGENQERLLSLATLFAYYPMRYAGPLIVAWLTARYLSAPERHRRWPAFAVAGLVVMNSPAMGVVVAGATLAALLWARRPGDRAEALSLAANVVGGFTAGIALVSAVTLIRSGSLPHIDQLTEFARMLALNGVQAVPLPSVRGLPLVIYGTFGAAIATATALTIGSRRDPVLVGMLAWVGVYGLGSAIYYVVGDGLVASFSAWALAVGLLAVAAFRSLDTGSLRRPVAPALVVFFGLGLTACSIAQFPSAPWRQVERLRNSTLGPPTGNGYPTPPVPADVGRFLISVADGPHRFVVRRGAPVALLSTQGHRIADAFGARSVTPYTGYYSLQTVEQVERTLDALRDAGGNTLSVQRAASVYLVRLLARRGFAVLTDAGLRRPHFEEANDSGAVERLAPTTVGNFVRWVDTRNLHPRALE